MEHLHIIETKLDNISAMVQQITQKEEVVILNSNQAAEFLGISISTFYKLTSAGKLTHYKPNGKLVFVKKEDLLSWIEAHKIPANDELSDSKRKGGVR